MITIEANDLFNSPLVSARSNQDLSIKEQEYYFGAVVPNGLAGFVFSSVTDSKDDNYDFFYRHLKDWASESSLGMYFLRVGSDLSKRSEFRTKMSLRKEIPIAHREGLVRFEVEGDDGISRLAVIGPLNEDAGFSSFGALLNWAYAVVVVSELEIEAIARSSQAWINVTPSKFLGFDFLRIFSDIESGNDLVVCRFFPCDNRKPSAVSVVFNPQIRNDQ